MASIDLQPQTLLILVELLRNERTACAEAMAKCGGRADVRAVWAARRDECNALEEFLVSAGGHSLVFYNKDRLL